MKTKLFAAALAALTLVSAGAASAQDYRRGGDGWRRAGDITIRTNTGRTFSVDQRDRLFHRLMDRPYRFQPGLTYAYTDRCNRHGCMVFVFADGRRRPIDRVFAPHLPDRRHGWRQARDFDRDYNRYGRYDRDERWDNDDDRAYRGERDSRRDESGESRRGDDRGGRRGDGSGLDGAPR